MNRPDLRRFIAKWSQATECPPFDAAGSRLSFMRAVQDRSASSSRSAARGWILAAAAALVILVGAGALWRSHVGSSAPASVTPGAWLETKASEQLPMQFAEGTQVVVHAKSRVHVESVDPRGASMVVERGTVSADIVHRADTNWSFSAGPFRVRVTGTRLAISWDPSTARFGVHVDRGSVVVTGPLLQDGRTVRGGESCSVSVRQHRMEVGRSDPEPQQEAIPHLEVRDLPVLEDSTETQTPKGGAVARWQELERQGRYAEAVVAAESVGLEPIYGSGSVSELMSLARAARLANRQAIAAQALLRCRARFPNTRQAATAAFLLGRSAPPSEAARWFTTYLGEQPSGPLAREAAGRLIESYHRAGDSARARQAATVYLAQYPSGPHAAFARSMLGD
ncbi:MAG: FecR domain-containing protein [Polyangiaceae bacterium]|nr:FecR domain-containing protein [Polyangiaceae bacterium]